VHVQPAAEESYAVVSGALDVCVGGRGGRWPLAAAVSGEAAVMLTAGYMAARALDSILRDR
jgi:hypothetical protein